MAYQPFTYRSPVTTGVKKNMCLILHKTYFYYCYSDCFLHFISYFSQGMDLHQGLQSIYIAQVDVKEIFKPEIVLPHLLDSPHILVLQMYLLRLVHPVEYD